MTVEDFMDLSVDETIQEVTLYSVELGKNIFTGFYDDMTDAMLEAEVSSFDVIDKHCPKLILNIEFEFDD